MTPLRTVAAVVFDAHNSGFRLALGGVANDGWSDVFPVPQEPGVIVRRRRRAWEPFDPIEQHDLAGEQRIVAEEMLTTDYTVEIIWQQHCDPLNSREGERAFDEELSQLAAAARAVRGISDDVGHTERRGDREEIRVCADRIDPLIAQCRH